MKTHFIALMLLLACSPVLGAEPELKGTPRELTNYLQDIPCTVQIVGEAEVKVQADRAVVTITVATEEKTLQDALLKNQQIRSLISAQLQQKGIAESDIRSDKFSSTPQYGLFGQKVDSYRVDNQVKITLGSEEQFRHVANLVDNHKEINYLGITFEHSNKEQLKLQALRQACQNAQAKRQIYQEQLDVALTPVSFSIPVITGEDKQELYRRYAAKQSAAKTPLSYSAELVAPLPTEIAVEARFDELIFKAQVIVEYRLQTKAL
ncbi:MAG: SIMPL domain-containing protein [Sedimentisphaerales bacterium]|nr:SIMPL domain-containing protein [Sedimentisphaerales bacterium]